MAESSTVRGAPGATATRDREGAIDWRAIERSEEFQELVRRRKRFIFPAAAISFTLFGIYLLLATFADDFMGTQIVDGLPVAWILAMAQVLLTWIVTWAYLRQSDRVFEPLERRAAARAEEEVEEVVATTDAGATRR